MNIKKIADTSFKCFDPVNTLKDCLTFWYRFKANELCESSKFNNFLKALLCAFGLCQKLTLESF